jgi:hypothetical protein
MWYLSGRETLIFIALVVSAVAVMLTVLPWR